MSKARDIQMDKIREVRNKELAKKDIEFMKALEADDGSSTAIAADKQALRDIPQTFDLTTDTPEELKEKWRKYHKENATLQLLCVPCHKDKTYKK